MDDRKVGKKEHERERSGDRRSSYVHRSHERHTSRSFSPGSDSHLKHSAHMKKEKKRDFPSSHLKRMCKRSRSRSSSGDFRDKHKSRKERCRPRSKNRPKDLRKRKRDDSSSESSDSECTRKHRPKKLKQNYGELKHRHKKRKQVYNSSSSDSTSDSDTSNSDSSLDSYSAECSPIRHKKKSKTSHKLYKKKKKKHKMKSRRKKSSKTDSGKVRSSADAGFEGPHEQHHSPKQVPETQGIRVYHPYICYYFGIKIISMIIS